MMTQEKLVLELKRASAFSSADHFKRFQKTLRALQKYKNKEVLCALLQCISDKEAGEVQYELIEACEVYDSAVYVPTFALFVFDHWEDAPKWFSLMLCSILNSKPHAKILLETLTDGTSKRRSKAISIIRKISSRDNRYVQFLNKMEEKLKGQTT